MSASQYINNALYHHCNISTLQYLIITNYWHYLMSAFWYISNSIYHHDVFSIAICQYKNLSALPNSEITIWIFISISAYQNISMTKFISGLHFLLSASECILPYLSETTKWDDLHTIKSGSQEVERLKWYIFRCVHIFHLGFLINCLWSAPTLTLVKRIASVAYWKITWSTDAMGL